MFIVDIVSLLGALGVLIVVGHYLVRSLESVTRAFRIPEFSVGFVLLAVSTSIPELLIGIMSARQETASLVLATALGSNIVNMTFIVGFAAIISVGIATRGVNVRRDLLFGGVITMLPVLFMRDAIITRFEGVILLVAFCLYIWRIYHDRYASAVSPHRANIGKGIRSLGMIALLIVALLLASEVTVRSATAIATELQVPAFFIGLFILAFGTSLPELVTTLNAALLRRPGLALGSILGSNVADSGLVVGLAAITRPLAIPITFDLIITAFFVFLSLLTIGWFAHTKKRISMPEGIVLVLIFVAFGVLLFGVSVNRV